MNHTYQDGRIIVRDHYFKEMIYHVSNECASMIFNGKGAVVGYALANGKDMMTKGSFSLFRGNAPIDIYSEKTVEMIGRCQTITLHLEDGDFKIEQFLDASVNGVFTSYSFGGKASGEPITVVFGMNKGMEDAVCVENRELHGKKFCFGASKDISWVAVNQAIYLTVGAGEMVTTFLSCGERPISALAILSDFEGYESLGILLNNNGWTLSVAVCFLMLFLFKSPCSTTFITVKKETGKVRYAILSILLPLTVGIVLSFITNCIISIF